MATVDMSTLRTLLEQGYLTGRPHPKADLIIWNYTPKTQFEGHWTPETRMCRGLITQGDGTIVARGFDKFFNLLEAPETSDPALVHRPCEITAKLDGSLGILYWVGNEPAIATRGSFTSEQALWATDFLRAHLQLRRHLTRELPRDLTLLFEIIYPENRVVVDYAGTTALFLLGARHIEDGYDYSHDFLSELGALYGFPVADLVPYSTMEALLPLVETATEIEGWVARFADGFRVKLKTEEYRLLHKVLTRTSARVIWEYLKENRPLAGLLERVPDEFYAWVKATAKELAGQYSQLHHRTQQVYREVTTQASIETPIPIGERITLRELETLNRAMKRELHHQFAAHPDIEDFLHLLHSARGKGKREQLAEAIWERLRPEATKPFRAQGTEEDAA